MVNAVMLVLAVSLVAGEPSLADGDADASPPASAAPLELAAPEMPTSVEDALGVEDASLWRRLGLAGAVTGGALLVVSAFAFSAGFDAERELLSAPHTRAQVDALLIQRGAAAAVAWPSLIVGALTAGGGAVALVIDHNQTAAREAP